MSLLELEDVTISFGGLTAVEGASFAVNPGEVFALVGPNGAGKSTIFNLVSRYCTPSGGDIRFEGKSILGCAP
ncbi:MAG: ATP-binding cassette domain-containing protein, partial [Boseongicola sp.]|nr:ATP-binding cassette domain-containing protein [Boseongicola sp.]